MEVNFYKPSNPYVVQLYRPLGGSIQRVAALGPIPAKISSEEVQLTFDMCTSEISTKISELSPSVLDTASLPTGMSLTTVTPVSYSKIYSQNRSISVVLSNPLDNEGNPVESLVSGGGLPHTYKFHSFHFLWVSSKQVFAYLTY